MLDKAGLPVQACLLEKEEKREGNQYPRGESTTNAKVQQP